MEGVSIFFLRVVLWEAGVPFYVGFTGVFLWEGHPFLFGGGLFFWKGYPFLLGVVFPYWRGLFYLGVVLWEGCPCYLGLGILVEVNSGERWFIIL